MPGSTTVRVTALAVTLAAFGRIDYLINNAGVAGAEQMVVDLEPEAWRATLRANLNSNYSLIEKVVPLMKQQGIVDSGESLAAGIGAMSEGRIKDFYAQMVKAGLYKPGEVDLSKVATFQFVNKKVGLDVKAKLGGK